MAGVLCAEHGGVVVKDGVVDAEEVGYEGSVVKGTLMGTIPSRSWARQLRILRREGYSHPPCVQGEGRWLLLDGPRSSATPEPRDHIRATSRYRGPQVSVMWVRPYARREAKWAAQRGIGRLGRQW